MGLKSFLGILFIIFAVSSFIFYWFLPLQEIEFSSEPKSTNFSIGNSSDMQFYPNMRFSESSISYKIERCPLEKKNNVEEAIEIIEEETILDFFESSEGELIVTCNQEVKVEGRAFVAGEGGPTEIIETGDFNLIKEGRILMIRPTKCQRPNVALHEIFHVLGFKHSGNSNNIMYNLSQCDQVIGDDMIETINNIYSIESNPDLTFSNVSASISGRYLDAEATISNEGLKESQPSELVITAEDNEIKTYDLDSMKAGFGVKVTLNNVWVSETSPDNLVLEIKNDFEELDKQNNRIELSVKK